jgi:hypothetical protein
MAFTTISWVACFESLFPVMTCSTAFASVDLSHFNGRTFFHLIIFCMAVIAFQTLLSVDFTVKYDLANRSFRKLDVLPDGTAKALPAKATVISRAKTDPLKRTSSPPF